MNYKDIKSLPSYVQKLPEGLKAKWVGIYNAAFKQYNEERALIIANTWLKKQLTKKEAVAKTKQSVSVVRFEVDDSVELIKRADNGEDYIDFVLTDNLPDSEGVKYPDTLLQKWAEQINNGDMLVGDYDHSEYDRLVADGLSADEVIAKLKEKPGIAKTLKAVFEKGKLWVRAIIDKRYKKLIKDKSKGVSLEALLIKDSDNNIVDGRLGGFTFALEHSPVNERAVIA